MDALSSFLAMLKPQATSSARLQGSGSWALQFPVYEGIKFNAIVSGRCCLQVDDGDPVDLQKGDCFLLPQGRSFKLWTDAEAIPVDAVDVFRTARDTGIAEINSGDEFVMFGCRFVLDGPNTHLLLQSLPPVVHLVEERGRSAMVWSLERMREDILCDEPGRDVVVDHLAHLMIVQAVRSLLRDGQTNVWLSAGADRRIGAALDLVHADPARRWSLAELASEVGMSRTVFSARFKEKVGMPAIEYLTSWRMGIAKDRLSNSELSIAEIATKVGYDTESAFGAAFERATGTSPRAFAKKRSA